MEYKGGIESSEPELANVLVEVMKDFPSAEEVSKGAVFDGSNLRSIDFVKLLPDIPKWVEDVDCYCSKLAPGETTCTVCLEALPATTTKYQAAHGRQPRRRQLPTITSDDNRFYAGRWTDEEHRLFLQGVEAHGKVWKDIAALVTSRTVIQIRTHAQKHFQKLTKMDTAAHGRQPRRRQKKRKSTSELLREIDSIQDPTESEETEQVESYELSLKVTYFDPFLGHNVAIHAEDVVGFS